MEPGMFRARFPGRSVPAVAGSPETTCFSMRQTYRFLAGFLLAASGFHAWGEERSSALEALQALQTRIGPDACQVLIAIHGQQGQDQPEEWLILTLNSQSPNLGQQYAVSRSGVVDKGVPPGLYPSETPPGFVDRSQVLIDSPYAFQVLHEASIRARVGFNSINYTLVAREYSKEAVWRLEAMDAKGRPVGQVDLSARSGAISRSVWYYWDEVEGGSAWQGPRIVDSLLPQSTPEGSGAQSTAMETAVNSQGAGGVRRGAPEAKEREKEKGGLFSRLRRGSRTLFGPSSQSPSPSTNPPPSAAAPEMAPEAGVAVPVPAGESAAGPTAEVAPASSPAAGAVRTPPVPEPPARPSSGGMFPPNR